MKKKKTLKELTSTRKNNQQDSSVLNPTTDSREKDIKLIYKILDALFNNTRYSSHFCVLQIIKNIISMFTCIIYACLFAKKTH